MDRDISADPGEVAATQGAAVLRANAIGSCAPDELVRVMNRVHGLDISGFEPSFLLRTLQRRAQASGCNSAGSYLTERLVKDRVEAEAFHRSLRVGYSAFFRDPSTFALLETQVLPDLAEKARKTGRGGLRVWSAGCAAGQEAWSLAMTASAMKGDREAILDRGFDGYVAKPIDAETLKKTIHEALHE